MMAARASFEQPRNSSTGFDLDICIPNTYARTSSTRTVGCHRIRFRKTKRLDVNPINVFGIGTLASYAIDFSEI